MPYGIIIICDFSIILTIGNFLLKREMLCLEEEIFLIVEKLLL